MGQTWSQDGTVKKVGRQPRSIHRMSQDKYKVPPGILAFLLGHKNTADRFDTPGKRRILTGILLTFEFFLLITLVFWWFIFRDDPRGKTLRVPNLVLMILLPLLTVVLLVLGWRIGGKK